MPRVLTMGAGAAHESKHRAARKEQADRQHASLLGVQRALAGPGKALEPAVQADIGRHFSHDFSRVRVHTDANASESARAVGARAYTVGSHVVFGEGQYDPNSGVGQKLLAHELAHTIQQSASDSRNQPITIEPAGTGLEQAAKESAARLTNGAPRLGRAPGLALQRQPVPQEEQTEDPEITIFVAEERKRRDRRFARQQAQRDAARITKSGTLSSDERSLVNAKLRFFEGDAWHTYAETIKPALTLAAIPEIEMPEENVSGKPAQAAYQYGEFFNSVRQLPTYLDNDIKEVNYFTAEVAHIHYRDGTKFELGLVAKWMKGPVVEVDYGTPLDEIRPFEDPVTKRFGFMLDRELASAPRTMPFSELVKTYVHFVDFPIEPGTGRVIPTRVNMLTAPTLCAVLLDSFRQYAENVRLGAYIGYHGTAAIGAYAGQGGIPKVSGLGPTTFFTKTAPRVLTPTGKKLWAEMDDLLTQGGTRTIEVEGTKFIDVTVARQGSTLAVRRFKSEVPANIRGGGMGTRLAKEFEDAAVELGRATGAKKVTVDVGIVTNPGWREVLEARGYIYTPKEGGWIKTITVAAE